MIKAVKQDTASAVATPGLGRPRLLRAKKPDLEASTLLSGLNLLGLRSLNHKNLRRQRMAWRLSAGALGRGGTVARVRTHRIPGPHSPIEMRVYRPTLSNRPMPAFIWFHGGAFLVGGLPTADTICRHIARVSGVIVVAVRYRLAPEHDLYAGREDCLAAVQWIANEGEQLGIDSSRLAIGGDSAGGNLAAAIAQRCVDLGAPALRLQALVYPATNLRDEFPSKQENASGYLLTSEGIDAIQQILDEGKPDTADPWLSPALRPRLDDLPPALVLTAGFDPIRDDGLAYVDRLREAGVPVQLLHYPGQFHGFINFDGVLRAARDALDRIGAALRHALAASDSAPAMPDRTLEVAIRATPQETRPDWLAGRSMLIAGLMWGERLEGWRADTVRTLMPWDRVVAAVVTSPLANPATSWRALLAQRFAAIEASETWRADA